MKKRLPSFFDLLIVLAVIVAVLFVHRASSYSPEEVPVSADTLIEEMRQASQRYTDWEAFDTPMYYFQHYTIHISDMTTPIEEWPEPGTPLTFMFTGGCPAGELLEIQPVPDTNASECYATVSIYCPYYKLGIYTYDSINLRLGIHQGLCLEDGTALGYGVIEKMN